jgi:hypothetical protein
MPEMSARRITELDKAHRRREVARTSVSVALSWAVLLVVYYVASFPGNSTLSAAVLLVVGVVLFGISVSRQLRMVVGADFPQLRALQALGMIVMLFLVVFASVYLALEADSPDSFSRPLNHTRALYFAITVFSTVGFGDITPETDPARIIVAIQMLLDLVLIGFIVRAFVQAAESGLEQPEVSQDGPEGS